MNFENDLYDVIVVGGGHAGCEAAAAAANMGSKTLLISMDMTKFGQMSCNPAIGGIAKGQIVREIDALGGYTGIVTDRSMIQFRMLNRSKGPAMWSPRAQCDRTQFTIEWRKILENIPNLSFWQDTVKTLLLNKNVVCGVVTALGIQFKSKCVVITAGTFQNGLIHVGRQQQSGGRMSEPASFGISDQLRQFGFEVGRMKTGTPARLDGRTINFKNLVEQKSEEGGHFSFIDTDYKSREHLSCFITNTNEQVHNVLERGFKDSPLYTGIIQGVGPRYCPSIEDKIVTFSSKTSHQLFLEPEGVNTYEYYLNGFSSSLPWDIQYKALRLIEGLENVKIFRPGYAIEYDYYPPTQLIHTLETKAISGLFFAGQVNGTTGYEEAAAQGLLAGINAHNKAHALQPFVLMRDEAYIGVLIDDLVIKGVDEPYRMFTSRAEYRVLLRQDNADIRLTQKSYNIGLANSQRHLHTIEKYNTINTIVKWFEQTSITPNIANPILLAKLTSEINQKTKIVDLVSRPQISIFDFNNILSDLNDIINTSNFDYYNELLEAAEIKIKYTGYIERERQLAEKLKRLEDIKISADFDYSSLHSLSTEAITKLNRIKPTTIGQASRIPGVNPSDINILLVHLGR